MSNGSARTNRIEKELQSLVGQYLNTSLPFKYGGIVSVTRVRASSDFKYAKVFISYFHPADDAEALKKVMASIEDARPDLQKHVGKSLKIKFTPKFSFYLDTSLQENFKLLEKLKELGFDVNTLTDDDLCQS
ncbi:MAG: 30S ribosome-binding factor RbfA [Bdellovibrionales bacterium]|nr:30S ribosome-binding factor RbfA [Bdellovibrionales bacterium]